MTPDDEAPTQEAEFPTQEAEVPYEGRHRLNEWGPVCADCGQTDLDIAVGWSLCAACFHSDRFDGSAYWAPLWCGLLLVAGVSFLVAVLVLLI